MSHGSTDTTWIDATETAERISAGRLSSVEAVSQALARIEALDPSLNAFVLVLREEALATARRRDAGPAGGPLHGVPVAVKDLFDIAGQRTGAGSLVFPDHRAAETAHAIHRLEAAGAVVLGKTQLVEFAFGGWGTNTVLGTPRNPFDQRRHRAPGGSSSGSAVAVASGMVPLALGTDTGGSIRYPSAFCGLFGHKSSLGLIGRSGTRYLSPSHDTVGPLARSPRDLLRAIEVMAGPDAGDAAAPVGLATATAGPPRLTTLADEALALMEPEVASAFQRLLDGLSARYGAIGRIRLPASMRTVCEAAGRLMAAESYASLHEVTDDLSLPIATEIRARINAGRSVTADEMSATLDLKRSWKAAFAASFTPFDILVMPSAPLLPPAIESIDQSSLALATFGRFVNMLDLCATSVPMGLAEGGLPMGAQLIGRTGADRTTLHLADDMVRCGLTGFTPPPA
ncbi:MAG: amidase [Xanthobacteraceae bacterium]